MRLGFLVWALIGASFLRGARLDTKIFTPCDVVLELNDAEAAAHPRPYETVDMLAEFRSPRAKTVKISAFWDGGRKLVLRLVPTEPGEWTYKISTNLKRFDEQEGKLTAIDNEVAGFVQPANFYHWQWTYTKKAHLWMGDTVLAFANLERKRFEEIVDQRAQQKFTHLRGLILGVDAGKVFVTPEQLNPAFFQELDARIKYANDHGLIVDVIFARSPDELVRLFPRWPQRKRFLTYVMARYSGFNVTWQAAETFESSEHARAVLKEAMAWVKLTDPYQHPRSTGAAVTSAALRDDGWMNYRVYGASTANIDPLEVGAIEHQLYATPALAVRFDVDGASKQPPVLAAKEFRRRLWRSTMNGQYPYYSHTALISPDLKAASTVPLDDASTKAMSVWFDVIASMRYWDTRPFFDIDGGFGIAVPTVEYLVYVEEAPGPIEVRVEKAGYDAVWINPSTGERIKMKDFHGDKFVGEAPDRERDWLLHLSRDGRKAGMLKSWKFEFTDEPIQLQEVESLAKLLPFQFAEPNAESLEVGKPYPYAAKLTKQTRATRLMQYLWLADATADGEGTRVAGTGATGTFTLSPNVAHTFPGVVNIRVYGMNANGKVYVIDKAIPIHEPGGAP